MATIPQALWVGQGVRLLGKFCPIITQHKNGDGALRPMNDGDTVGGGGSFVREVSMEVHASINDVSYDASFAAVDLSIKEPGRRGFDPIVKERMDESTIGSMEGVVREAGCMEVYAPIISDVSYDPTSSAASRMTPSSQLWTSTSRSRGELSRI